MSSNSISVLVTLFNHERYIGEALLSAIRPTRRPAEIVVIDDASTDSSVDVVKRLAEPAVRLIQQDFLPLFRARAAKKGIDLK